jgi:uncharacterized small protein (DUF1192 family)
MISDDDDLVAQQPAARRNLEAMSMEALTAYIAELEAEIERVRSVLAAKRQARAGAEAVFKL